MDKVEPIVWKGLTYERKPFTLDTYFAVVEASVNGTQGDKILRDTFRSNCKAILIGTTPQAQTNLNSGNFATSILNEPIEGEIVKAMEIKDLIDSFSQSFVEQATKLKNAAPDLAPAIEAQEKKLSQTSPKALEQEAEHYG